MATALADIRIDAEAEHALSRYVDKIIKLSPFSRLASPVASHPDMLVLVLENKIFTWNEYFEQNTEIFHKLNALGFDIQCIDEVPSKVYPDDIRLNCAVMGRNIIANEKYISRAVLRYAEKAGYKILHTSQGYAKCSAVTLTDNALITADMSLYKTATAFGIDALKITEGHVRLDGYDTGFIGGASGISEKNVLFCGNLSLHPDGDAIARFCMSHNKNAISLTQNPLYDFGTVIILK